MASQARRSTPVHVLGRLGMVCYGVVHLLVAYLALRIAIAGSGQPADKNGAVAQIASTSGGAVLMWVLAIGLFAFALWQVLLAAAGYRWRAKKRERVSKRIGSVVRAAIASSVGVTAVKFATGNGGGKDGDQQQQEFTARLLELPAGPLLVGVVALAVLGFGVVAISSGVRRSFMKDLDVTKLPAGSQRWVRRIGAPGFVGKGVAFAIVGVLIGLAAIRANPGQAGGLDAALRTLAGQPFGAALLFAVALGFAGYAVYCFAAARSHRT
jgi:Domain of Unknown Function (DUF1206)